MELAEPGDKENGIDGSPEVGWTWIALGKRPSEQKPRQFLKDVWDAQPEEEGCNLHDRPRSKLKDGENLLSDVA